MNVSRKIFPAVRLILTSALCAVLTACAAGSKPALVEEAVASDGFLCPQPAPRVDFESEEINIYTWAEYVPEDIFECFGLVYGVKMNVDYFSSNEELYSKVSLGASVNPYDVIHPSDYMIGVLMREGLLQKLDKTRLPNLANLDADLIKAYGASLDYLAPYQMGTQAIIYNAETVNPAPTAWADLWNPAYKGRIVAVEDSRVIIGAALLTLGYDVNDTDPSHLAQAKQKLLELMPNIRVFDADSPKTALIAGDVDLGIVWNGEAFLTQSEDPRFEYVFPKEGSITFYDGMGISPNAPHADAAYAWLNYLLQGGVNWLTLTDYPYTNPNRAALDYAKENHPDVYEAYISSPITNTPASEFERGHEVKDVGEALLLYDQIWTEIKK
ncbi:MAG: spermidine/putrescine ABC transporter substrate-binding protein [Anaerolineales bacterium]|nr:spermidine/putrescine ABC transporter substrate-binding protein [Anaerolineales bacterium]